MRAGVKVYPKPVLVAVVIDHAGVRAIDCDFAGEICVRTIVVNPVIAEDVHKSEVRYAYVIVRTGCLKPERVVEDGFRPVNYITGWIGVEIIEICDTAIWRGVSTAGEIADRPAPNNVRDPLRN